MKSGSDDDAGKDWRQLYQAALIETDLSALPGRIELASNAVQERLRELMGSREEIRERDSLLDALRTLRALAQEKR